MNKTAIIALALAGVIALGSGGVFAAGQIAKSNSIGEEAALNFAYVDAGILPENAQDAKAEFEFEKGKFVYDIEFKSNGVKYEYTIDSGSGLVIEKEVENISTEKKTEKTTEEKPAETAKTETPANNTEVIGVEKAKEIALAKAGVKAADAIFSKTKLDRDDGRQIYDIEFYVADTAEYDFEIDALTGDVIEHDIEKINRKKTAENGNGGASGTPANTGGNTGNSGNSESAGTTPAPAPSSGNGSSTPAAPAQPTTPAPAPDPENNEPAVPVTPTPAETAAPTPAAPEPITVEQAKAIALANTGLNAGDVVFEKAKIERDDGRLIYDIEFYVAGQTEYDFELDAYTGAVLEQDSEPWEYDD